MTSERKLEIMLSILAYSQGQWSAEECYDYFLWIMTEFEDKQAKLKVITNDGTDAH